MKFITTLFALLSTATLFVSAQRVEFAAPTAGATIQAGKNFTVTLHFTQGSGIDVEKGLLLHFSGQESPEARANNVTKTGTAPPNKKINDPKLPNGKRDSVAADVAEAVGVSVSADSGIVLYNGGYKPQLRNGKCCWNDLIVHVPQGWFLNGPAILTYTRMYIANAAGIPELDIKHLKLNLQGN